MNRRPPRTILTAATVLTTSALLASLGTGCGDDGGTASPAASSAPAAEPASASPPADTSAAPSAATATASAEPAAGGAAPDAGDGGDDTPDAAPKVSGEAPPPPPPPPKPVAKAGPKPPPPPTPAPPPPPKVTPPPPPPAQPPAPPPAKTASLPAAKEGSADAVAEQIDKLFLPVKRFRARFDQKYTAKVHGTTKKSKGILYVLKPGKISLSYQDPNKNRAVSDGTTLKVYEHENKQMFLKDVKNTEYPGAFAFILGKGLRQSFNFEFHKNSKWEGGPVLIGTPRVKNPGYETVLFYIDESLLAKGDLGAVRRVLVIDAQKNKNRFDFVRASSPESIKDTMFEFTPPAGTEIIKG